VLSPDGRHLAVLVPIKGRSNLAVIDLESRASKVLTGIERFDVLSPHWVGNERLVFTLGEQNTPTGPGRFEGGGLFSVNRDGSDSRRLAPTVREARGSGQAVYRAMELVATLPDNERDLLVTENARTADGLDLYRLDLTNGRKTLLTPDRPERVMHYVLDRQRVARVAVSTVKDRRIEIIWYRDSETSTWTELTRIDDEMETDTNGRFVPLLFDDDNRNLIVAANRGRNTMALFRYDPGSKTFGDALAGHPLYDMGANTRGAKVPGLVLSHDRRVLGYEVDAEQRQPVWVDERLAKLQASMDKALPNRVNRLQTSGGARVLVESYSDRSAPEYFVYDERSRKLEFVVSSMSWLKADHLVEMRPFVLKTRDGLEIPSYYFLPRNHKAGERLPTVLHIHGGPMVRADHWGPLWFGGFGVAEAQLLASRGYAVVLPNFRITPGFGSRIYHAGRQSIGRTMSEDHEDAVKWAVEHGFADPKRVCISGASYGGYATLRALAKTPDLFACGIAGLPVSDLELQLTSTSGDTAYSETSQSYWRNVIIGEDKAPGTARAMSPVHQAAQFRAPVFFYAGADDIRTPLEQTTRMVDALRKAGHKPELIIKPEEGHGYGRLENRIELWEKMLDFLDRQIGSRAKAP
jgi:dipeptidyl aminopeptidase/acylaminoacyl peptidase